MTTRREAEKCRETKFLILTDPRETVTACRERPCMVGGMLREGLNHFGGELREGVRPRDQVPSLGVWMEYTSRGLRGFHWCILLLLGHCQGDKKGNLQQGSALSCWCAWAPGQVLTASLWGC